VIWVGSGRVSVGSARREVIVGSTEPQPCRIARWKRKTVACLLTAEHQPGPDFRSETPLAWGAHPLFVEGLVQAWVGWCSPPVGGQTCDTLGLAGTYYIAPKEVLENKRSG